MSIRPLDLTGGPSAYCFNAKQLEKAYEMAQANDESGEKIRNLMTQLENDLTRNELAALAFVIIDQLNRTSAWE